MRRIDREMSREFGKQVIDRARFGTLSMIDKNGEPYCIPLSIVRDENTLYFHSAADGKKVRLFECNPRVCIAFVGKIKIPENYTAEQLQEIAKDETKAALLISSVFTTEYESALVEGRVELVEDENVKIKAMRLICEKYTPSKMGYFDMAVKAGLGRAHVYKVEIFEISAKRKKYDKSGEEMKWGRME